MRVPMHFPSRTLEHESRRMPPSLNAYNAYAAPDSKCWNGNGLFAFPVLVYNCWTENIWGICGEKSTFPPHIPHIIAIKCPPQHFIKKFPTNSPSIPFKSTNSLHFTHGQINILSIGPHFINILSYAQLASCQNG